MSITHTIPIFSLRDCQSILNQPLPLNELGVIAVDIDHTLLLPRPSLGTIDFEAFLKRMNPQAGAVHKKLQERICDRLMYELREDDKVIGDLFKKFQKKGYLMVGFSCRQEPLVFNELNEKVCHNLFDQVISYSGDSAISLFQQRIFQLPLVEKAVALKVHVFQGADDTFFAGSERLLKTSKKITTQTYRLTSLLPDARFSELDKRRTLIQVDNFFNSRGLPTVSYFHNPFAVKKSTEDLPLANLEDQNFYKDLIEKFEKLCA